VLHDQELDFFEGEPRGSALVIAVGPSMIVTGHHYPLRSPEAMKQRIDAGARVKDVAGALELICAALADVLRALTSDLDAQLQAIEDELPKDRPSPDERTFIDNRSLMVRMHRLFSGAQAQFRGPEDQGEALQACFVAVRRPALDHRPRPPGHPEPDTVSAR
jgi:Mg2+ and Co2+ transporter CorA